MNLQLKIAVCLLVVAITANAQGSSNYNKRASEVQKEVWNNAPGPFSVTTIPDSLKNESAVIIATSYEVYNSVKGSISTAKGVYFQTTMHQRIKIGDKSALDEYSTLEYKKLIDRSFSSFLVKIKNITNRYIGATIIKPSGEQIVVNTNEEVLTQNEARYKAAKLAISDLQVGDILDYYVRIEQTKQSMEEARGPYNFFIGGEYPVLYESIRLVLDNKSNVTYISANGAPLLNESSDNDNFILSLEQPNIPKREINLWSSPFRQYPYIAIKYTWATKAVARQEHTERGVINHNNANDDLIGNFKRQYTGFAHSMKTQKLLKNMLGLSDIVATAFGGAANMENASLDSLLHVFHNAFRYYSFSGYVKRHINNVNSLTYYTSNSQISAIIMSSILNTYDIDHEICLVPSRQGPSVKNILDQWDLEAILRLHTNKGTLWMGFDDIALQYNEIPVRLQGEEAITIKPQGNIFGGNFSTDTARIPELPASANAITEVLKVSLKPQEPTTLLINRTCTETGAMRHNEQRDLLLTGDIEKTLATAVKQPGLIDQLSDKSKTSGLSQEFDAAFAQDKASQKKAFEDEIKDQYSQEAKELTSYSIDSNGIMNDPFVFKESFTMDNLVKKAGNNYIVEAGKLIGHVTTVEEKDRIRNMDIYMYSARSFTYNIELTIPDGYNVKGLDNFNKSITNETGSLISSARQDGNRVLLTISRTYNHSKEHAANWPKMLQLIDELNNVYTQKLLLEKKTEQGVD